MRKLGAATGKNSWPHLARVTAIIAHYYLTDDFFD